MSIVLPKIENYKANSFPKLEAHYESLKAGQAPHTLMITCSDSRVCPQEITESQAGDLFIIRNAGNLVPAYNPNEPSHEGLTLEYGVVALGVKEVVVLGHSSCGAMAGLKETDKIGHLPLVQKALENYRNAYASEVEGKELDELISWNVNNQLKSIFSYPFVQEKMKSGELKVFGFVYDFVHGDVVYKAEINASGEVQ